MSKIDDGGQAFSENWNEGLTIRDYFAAKAMAALLSRRDLYFVISPVATPPRFSEFNCPRKCYSRVLAELSYQAADAMLAARKGGAS